jgi:hypothetical protein
MISKDSHTGIIADDIVLIFDSPEGVQHPLKASISFS